MPNLWFIFHSGASLTQDYDFHNLKKHKLLIHVTMHLWKGSSGLQTKKARLSSHVFAENRCLLLPKMML